MTVKAEYQQQSELHEIAVSLSSQVPADRMKGLGYAVALDSQGVDCQSVYSVIHNVAQFEPGSPTYIRCRRYIGVMNEKYLEHSGNLKSTIVQSVAQDFGKHEPLIRGIAVRHAGSLATDETADQLVPIVLRGAANEDPYVRKAAALAILNLHETKPSFISKFKLGPVLKTLVEDANPNVAANAVAALSEINASHSEPIFTTEWTTVSNLLAAADQATEWSQASILDFVATYKPRDASDARGVIARVLSRLSHANAAVVLSAIRCCLQMNAYIDDQVKVRETLSKVVLPLVTLLNNVAPIQYIAVTSILLLLQNHKRMLSSEVSIFFCKYDDPLYMKLVKLDVVLTLANTQNIGKVLEELYDYAQQTDVEFVRKSIRAIGKVAVQFESAAVGSVDKIVALIDTKVQFVVQECIIVAVDIFRRYPGRFEGIIANINANLTGSLDDHRAKTALVWILGEYAENIDNAGQLLAALFIDEFQDESADVQLAILTAVVKYYLVCDNEDGDDMLRKVIKMATTQIENPAVRDRAFQYYWLVSEAPDQANDILFPETQTLPKLTVELCPVNPDLVAGLVPQIGTLATLYHKLPGEFIQSTKYISLEGELKLEKAEGGEIETGMSHGASTIEQMRLPVLVNANDNAGVEIRGTLMRIGDSNSFVIRFTNYSEVALHMRQIAFNKNVFGFAPGEFGLPPAVGPQKTLTVNVPVIYSEQHLEGAQPSATINIAIQVNREQTIFFESPAPLDLILVPADQGGKLSREQFMATWGGINSDHEWSSTVDNASVDSVDVAKHKMQQNRLFFVAKKNDCTYFSGKTIQGEILIVTVSFEGNSRCKIGIKMMNAAVAGVILNAVINVIK